MNWLHPFLVHLGLILGFLALLPTSFAATLTEAQQRRLTETQAIAPAGFTVLAQPPFIVAGDETPEQVRRHAEGTIQWAVDRLKQDFFTKDPDEVIVIWLFKDKSSYDDHVWQLFHETPASPYGYYSTRHHALIMNIGTGSGTLVHEIVHPYVRANFPQCPAWFNEGLGSLFEQASDQDGHIHGHPNWRLPGLQEMIRAGQTLPFATLTALSDVAFYDALSGYNQHYGQARYLCYYLQEHELLIPFYREFREHVAEDPTGYRSLKKILKTEDMAKFQRRWEKFVLKLSFP